MFKHIYITLLLVVMAALTELSGQRQITAAEYFWDVDPGVGLGTALVVGSPADSVNITSNISVPANISYGEHWLFVRTRQTVSPSGRTVWGQAQARRVWVMPQIVAAEYFFDTDPGVGMGSPLAIATVSDSVNIISDITVPSNIAGGLRRLYIRTKDSRGLWSILENRPVNITSGTSIVAAEYFVDTDPGIGLGTPISVSSSIDSINFNATLTVPSNLSGGLHRMYVRTKDGNGQWSLAENKPFYVNTGQSLTKAEWFIDNDPGVGLGTPITFASVLDSLNLNANIVIPNNVAGGAHRLYVRTFSGAKQWSLSEGRIFYVTPSITAAEYFFDTDPGVGMGTSITIAGPTDSLNITPTLSFQCLALGEHKAYVRTRDAGGQWSLHEPQNFSVTNCNMTASAVSPGVGPSGTPVRVIPSTTCAPFQYSNLTAGSAFGPSNQFLIPNGTTATLAVMDATGCSATVDFTAPAAPTEIAPGAGATFAAVKTLDGWNQPVYFLDVNGKVIASVNDNGQNLGAVSVSYTSNNGPIRKTAVNEVPYLDRNWLVNTANTPASPITVKYHFLENEFNAIDAADVNVSSISDLNLATYLGVNRNLTYNDNNNGAFVLLTPSARGNGDGLLNGRDLTANIPALSNFHEAYIMNRLDTVGAIPGDLEPVVLVNPSNACAFTANENITVRVRNYAILPIHSFTIRVSINGGPVHSENVGTTFTVPANGTNDYTFRNLTANLLADGNYTFQVTVSSAGDPNSSNNVLATTVTNFTTIPVVASPLLATICEASTQTFTASGVSSYLWSNSANTASISVSPATTQTYTVTGTDINGCTSSAQVQLNVLQRPAVVASPSAQSICPGTTSNINASGATSYLWSTGTTGNSLVVGNAGTYSVTGTDNNGCTNAATASVGIFPTNVQIITSGATSFCAGGSVSLSANVTPTASSYMWSTGATSASINVSTSGVYTVQVTTTDGCVVSASQGVTVNAIPTVVVSATSTTICQNSTIGLSATGANSYVWSSGQNAASFNASPMSTTTYTVTGTSNGCAATASILVNVNAAPNVSITGPNTVCPNAIATLNASGAATYLWNTNATGSGIAPTVTSNTTFSVVGTDANGCTALASQNVGIFNTNVSINANGPTTFCDGASVTLSANAIAGATAYTWSNSVNTQSITVATSGVYTVNLTTTDGCAASASIGVNVLPAPTVSILPANASICAGNSQTFTATTNVPTPAYTWSTGAISSSISENTGGTIVVTVSDGGACQATATVQLTVNALPTVTVTASATTICQGQSSVLSSNSSTSGTTNWSNIHSGAIQTVSPSSTTVYTLTLTDTNGCEAIDSKTITVLPGGVNISSSTGSFNLCAGAALNLIATGNATDYSWSTSANTQSITINAGGSFGVTTTATNGCVFNRTVTVTLNNAPSISISPANASICGGQSVTLTANGGNAYVWSNGATSGSISVSPSTLTTYTVTGTSSVGCVGTASRAVSVTGNLPSLAFSNTSAAFSNHLVNILVGNPYQPFQFQVKYTDADNDAPANGYPKLRLDYEGNGIYTNANDRLLTMTALDPSDVNYTDGKIYVVNVPGMSTGDQYQAAVIVQDVTQCDFVTFGNFNEPDVLDDADVFIFADDITFSDPNPDTSQALVVNATIHNNSDYPAATFVARLRNEAFPAVTYPDITVSNLAAHSQRTVSWNIVAPNVASWNPMRVSLDITNQINEPNELDNTAIRPFVTGDYTLPGGISVTAAASPQQSISSPQNIITISGRALYYGVAVPLTNYGVAGAPVNLTVLNTPIAGTVYTDLNGYYSWSFNAPITTGLYNVSASVTDFTLDGNAGTQFVVNPAPCQPDLTAYIALPSGIVLENDLVNATITVANDGCATAPAGWLLSIGASGSNLTPGNEAINTALAPGQRLTFVKQVRYPNAGSYTLVANADVNNNITPEISENNNFAQAGLNVQRNLPDLVAGLNTASFSNQSYCGNAINNGYSWRVDNTGGANAPAYRVKLTMVHNGVSSTQFVNMPTLAAGNYTYVNFSHTYNATGTYTWTMEVDDNALVTEIQENNNAFVFTQVISACPPPPAPVVNLAVAGSGSWYVVPSDPLDSTHIDIVATILNNGNTNVTSTFAVSFTTPNGTYSTTVNGLAAGAYQSVRINHIPKPSNPAAILTVVVDANNQVSESNEADNSQDGPLHWDFVAVTPPNGCANIPRFWFYPQVVNRPFDVVADFWSMGMFSANAVRVKFEYNGPETGNVWQVMGYATGNNIGRSNTLLCPHTVGMNTPFAVSVPGNYQFRFTVDENTVYPESNEGNNSLTLNFVVQNLPDYVVRSQYIDPSLLNPDVNEAITINVTYENIGITSVPNMEMLLMVDDVRIDSAQTRGLNSLDTWTVPFTNRTWSSSIPGIHIIRARIDSDNQIAESDETNNDATRAIVVGQSANLKFASFDTDNATPAAGQYVNIRTNIQNTGDQDCDATVRFFYEDNLGQQQYIGQLPVSVNANSSRNYVLPWQVNDASTTMYAEIFNATPQEYTQYDNRDTFQLGLLHISTSSTPASCIGATDGTASVSATGGTAPYTYIWTPGGVGQTVSSTPGILEVVVTDADGNTANASVTVGVIPDNSAPLIFNVPANINYVATDGICPATITWTAPSVTDNCGVVGVTASHAPGTTFTQGTTTVTYTARDAAGNIGRASFLVTVQGTPLLFAGNDANICNSGSLNATAPAFGSGTWSVVNGNVILADAQNAQTAITITSATATLRWTVNNGTCFTGFDDVTITNPCACVANVTISSGPACPNQGIATANVTGSAPFSYQWSNGATSASISGLNSGVYTVTVIATGGCSTSSSVQVTASDTQVPTLVCLANQNVTGTNSIAFPDYTTVVTATDACSAIVSITQFPAAGTTITANGPMNVYVSATDASGNMATCTFVVNLTITGGQTYVTGGDLPCNYRPLTTFGAVPASNGGTTNCYSILGNNIGVSSFNDPTDCGSTGDKGVFYAFRMPSCGTTPAVRISTNNAGTSLAGTNVAVYTVTNPGSCSSVSYQLVACSGSSTVTGCSGSSGSLNHGTLEFAQGALVNGGSYYIYVSGDNGTMGNFELTFEYLQNPVISVTAGPTPGQAVVNMPANGQSQFKVQWRPAGSTGWATSALLTGLSYTLPAGTLMPGVSYEFRALYQCAGTNWVLMSSNIVNFATVPTVATCAPVAGLSCNNISGSVTTTWSPVPAGTGTRVTVALRNGATNLVGSTVASSVTSVVFTNRPTATSMQVQSSCGGAAYIAYSNCAVSAAGQGAPIVPVTFEYNGITYEGIDFNDPQWGLFGAQPEGDFDMSVANGQLIITDESMKASDFDFELRPSVATDFTNVVISTEQAVDAQLSLSDMNGSLLKSQMLKQVQNGTVVTLETTELPDGLYIVSLRTNDGAVSRKLVKIN